MGGGIEQLPPRFSPAVTPRWQGNLKVDEPGADEAMEGFPVAGVVCPTYENQGDAGSAAHFFMNTAVELSVGGDTACVQGDVKTASTTACEQEWNAELDEVSVAGVVCPPYEDQSGALGAALFLMSSANDVIDTITNNSDSLSLSTEAEAEKPKKMPKTKMKFGRGVNRGTDRKQGHQGCGNAHDRQAPTDATISFARGHVPTVTRNLPVKYMTKAQLSKSLVTSEVRTLLL
jgi:hypothetical protein